jgi:hypothetical protein
VETKGDGSVERYKARPLARGFSHINGLDYDETYAPVRKYTTSCISYLVATYYGWDIQQMDVVNAFLND